MRRTFTYVLEVEDPLAEYTVETVASALGLRTARRPARDWGAADLWRGNQPPDGFTGIVIPMNGGDLFWNALLRGEIDQAAPGSRLPFDLLGAIGRFLTDALHSSPGPDDLDGHGRLRFGASAQARAGWGGVPVVDRYVGFIGALLEGRGIRGLPAWPDGRVAAIGLSHDVDEPERYALLEQAVRPWRLRRAPRTYARAVRAQAVARRRLHGRDDYWLFDEVIESERRLGFQSTFFFAVTPFHDTWGAPEDVAYDIDGRRSRKSLALVREAGFEIGLHAGYRAHERAERFAFERSRLAEVAGVEVAGLRHHYWHLGPEPEATLRSHEAAGFRYDSSIAFNDHVGFRRSTALPYHPYDRHLHRPLTTLQLPAVCMDGNLFYGSNDIEAAVLAVDGLVDMVAAVGGFGSIDWHIQASYPGNDEFRTWGIAYQQILGLLAARPELWVTDLGSVERWVADRERRRRDLDDTVEAPAT